MKRKPIMSIIGLLVGFMIAVAGCSTHLSRTFYQHHPRSLQDVEKDWGKPVKIKITMLENDIEKRVYPIQSPYTDLKYRYFLFRDGMVLASGLTDIGKAAPADVHQQSVGFNPSDLSEAFYANNRTTVAHIDDTWGEPVLIEKDDNGLEKWVYELKIPVDAGFSFRYFVIDDGMVISSGVRDTLEIAAK